MVRVTWGMNVCFLSGVIVAAKFEGMVVVISSWSSLVKGLSWVGMSHREEDIVVVGCLCVRWSRGRAEFERVERCWRWCPDLAVS